MQNLCNSPSTLDIKRQSLQSWTNVGCTSKLCFSWINARMQLATAWNYTSWQNPVHVKSNCNWPELFKPTPGQWQAWKRALQSTLSWLTLRLPFGSGQMAPTPNPVWLALSHRGLPADYKGWLRHSPIPCHSWTLAFHSEGSLTVEVPAHHALQVASIT